MKAFYDLLIRNASVSDDLGTRCTDLAIVGEKISAVGAGLEETAKVIIEGDHYFVLPGYIDAHVHLNEPGRTEWEGFATGTRALAAGGCTTFFDMPLNSTPVLDAKSFKAKESALIRNSLLDGAFWGGLVPGNLHCLEELADCGVIGFKAFMSDSGMPDFPRADITTLREGMDRAASLRLPVAVHAESEEMTKRLTTQLRQRGQYDIRAYLDSRPIAAELEAIGEAIEAARQTGCSLHVVHVSSAAGLHLIRQAKERGQHVTAEVCPHYLLLDEDDLFLKGAVAKCAPPLRESMEREALWKALEEGVVDTIGSDHSPSPPELKINEDFFEVWGGIAGCQHNFPLLFEEAVNRKIDPSLVPRLTAKAVAKRFRLPAKGSLEVGGDADLVILRKRDPRRIEAEELLTRHPISPYLGRESSMEVVMTIAMGRIVYGPSREAPLRPARILRPDRSI